MDQWEDFAAAFPEIRELPPLTADEIERLAPSHPARLDPAFTVERGVWHPVPVPLRWGCTNAAAVVFDGAAFEPAWGEALGADEA